MTRPHTRGSVVRFRPHAPVSERVIDRGRRALAFAGVAESNGAVPDLNAVRRLDGTEAVELGALAAVFDDLQYSLRCCEHLVGLVARRSGPVPRHCSPPRPRTLVPGDPGR